VPAAVGNVKRSVEPFRPPAPAATGHPSRSGSIGGDDLIAYLRVP